MDFPGYKHDIPWQKQVTFLERFIATYIKHEYDTFEFGCIEKKHMGHGVHIPLLAEGQKAVCVV